MKINFFGTSDGYPEKDRYCSCTVVTVNGKHYVIDAGLSLYSALLRHDYSPADVNGIFITHMHGDHASGLAEYVNLMIWGSRFAADPEICVPSMAGKLGLLSYAYAMDKGRDVDVTVFREGKIFEDENVRITAYRTQHTDASFGFLVEGEGKRVYFTGDIRNDLADLPELLFNEPTDLVICESAHNRLPNVADKFNSMKTKQVIINHVASGHSYKDFDECKPLINKPFSMAFDDMIIEL